MPSREEILKIIGDFERRDTTLGLQEEILIPDVGMHLTLQQLIGEMINEGFVTPDDMGNIYTLGDSGLKMNIAMTSKGKLLYDRIYNSRSKDDQIIELFKEGIEVTLIARMVEASDAYIHMVISNIPEEL